MNSLVRSAAPNATIVLKMDVEGAEEVVLPRLWDNDYGVNFLKDHITQLFMEVHGERANNMYHQYKDKLGEADTGSSGGRLRLLDSEEQFKCDCGMCLCGVCEHTK